MDSGRAVGHLGRPLATSFGPADSLRRQDASRLEQRRTTLRGEPTTRNTSRQESWPSE